MLLLLQGFEADSLLIIDGLLKYESEPLNIEKTHWTSPCTLKRVSCGRVTRANYNETALCPSSGAALRMVPIHRCAHACVHEKDWRWWGRETDRRGVAEEALRAALNLSFCQWPHTVPSSTYMSMAPQMYQIRIDFRAWGGALRLVRSA